MKHTSALFAALAVALVATPTFAQQAQTTTVKTQELDHQPTGSIEPCKRFGLFSAPCDSESTTTPKHYPEAPSMPQFGL